MNIRLIIIMNTGFIIIIISIDIINTLLFLIIKLYFWYYRICNTIYYS